MIDWLQESLAADFYVTAPGGLSDATADQIAGSDRVAFVSRSQWYELPTANGPVEIWALGLPDGREPELDIREGDAAEAFAAFANDQAVLISEPFAAQRNLTAGDVLRLPAPGAPQAEAFVIAGVYRDYSSPTGVVAMRRALYRSLYDDPVINGIGVHATGDEARTELAAELEATVAGIPGARVTDNAEVFEQSLIIFDRTFAITEVLRWLAGLVAFVGVISALMALHLDRMREFSVLRAIGITRAQLAGMVTGQSGLLGFAAGLWAIPLGVALAGLLVFVVNRRAYGWTMGFDLQPAPLLEGVLLAVIAALLASIYPAVRAARLRLSQGLKGE